MDKSKKNVVAKMITIIAYVVYGLMGIAGLITIGEAIETTILCWVAGFLSGTMMLGFAEIIKLLDDIKNK